MSIRVGIPCGLMNIEHEAVWDTFYRELGAEVIKSGPTNREILDKGIDNCVAEACLPVKIFHGHVAKLADKADYILIPRYTSISKRKYVCPKMGGLPDLVRNSIDNLPPVIDVEVNFYKNAPHGLEAALNSVIKPDMKPAVNPLINLKAAPALKQAANSVMKAVMKTAMEAGSYITDDRSLIKKACINALKNYQNSREKFIASCHKDQGDRLKIAVLGHPYMLRDSYVNMNLISKLEQMGITVITPEMRSTPELRKTGDNLPKKIFWDFGARAVGFARKMITDKVDGVLYVSSFGCGIDAFVGEIVSAEIKQANIPFSLINIDEHTGEAGMDTRLEAFADMISRRRNSRNENHISSFGQCIYNS